MCNGNCAFCFSPRCGGVFYVNQEAVDKKIETAPKLGTQEHPIVTEDEQQIEISDDETKEETGLSVVVTDEYEVKKNLFGKLVAKRK